MSFIDYESYFERGKFILILYVIDYSLVDSFNYFVGKSLDIIMLLEVSISLKLTRRYKFSIDLMLLEHVFKQ